MAVARRPPVSRSRTVATRDTVSGFARLSRVNLITPTTMAQTFTDGGARDFFDGYAADFDHIYDDTGKGPIARFIDVRLRKEMRIRFSNAFDAMDPLAGRSLLDAGCGGGRYAIPAAMAGASHVLGLDLSEPI